MESEIINQKKNPFLSREEITIKLVSAITPNEAEVKAAIGKDAELIVIKKIKTNFGRQSFIANAVIYDSVEEKEKIETIPQKVRKKMAAEKKAAEEAAAKAAEAEKKAAEEAKAAEESAKAAKTEEKTEAPEEVTSEEAKEKTE